MHNAKELQRIANELRWDALTLIFEGKDGHPGPALSCADIITVLYYNIMNIRPSEPEWMDRDRLILSKGHACPVLYAVLGKRGYMNTAKAGNLRALDSMLQGHPDMNKTPGVDMTTGSLGNGIAIGLGMALAAKHLNKTFHVNVIVGDGELQEGVIWEAVIAAAHHKTGNLIVYVDQNGLQSGGPVQGISSAMQEQKTKWESFQLALSGDRRPQHG